MRELGWIEGQNFTVENLVSEGRSERFLALAAELVQRKVDLIVTAGTQPTTAARNATATTPIVFFFVGDPVESARQTATGRDRSKTYRGRPTIVTPSQPSSEDVYLLAMLHPNAPIENPPR